MFYSVITNIRGHTSLLFIRPLHKRLTLPGSGDQSAKYRQDCGGSVGVRGGHPVTKPSCTVWKAGRGVTSKHNYLKGMRSLCFVLDLRPNTYDYSCSLELKTQFVMRGGGLSTSFKKSVHKSLHLKGNRYLLPSGKFDLENQM